MVRSAPASRPCGGDSASRQKSLPGSICAATAATRCSARLRRRRRLYPSSSTIALRHRLRSSSRQQPERASGTGPVAVSSSCKKRSSARTASPRSSSPTPTSDPPVSSSRVPGHPNLLYCPCYSTATARFSFNLVICVCSN